MCKWVSPIASRSIGISLIFNSGTTILEGYGLSEASPVTHRNPIAGIQKPGSIGIPIPNTDAKIVDLETGKYDITYWRSWRVSSERPTNHEGILEYAG